MKVAVLGATGGTGKLVVSEALEAGHQVVVVARNPEKLETKHENLKVEKADLADSSQLEGHFRGCDAVLSCIGGQAGMFVPCSVYTTVGKSTITAMRGSGVNRFVCLTAWGTKDHPDLPFSWRYVLKTSFLRNVVKNMSLFEDFLHDDCSDINYTVVRPPRLVNGPASGKPLQVSEEVVVEKYETNQMSRLDLAKFMLTCLSTDEYKKKMVAVTARKE